MKKLSITLLLILLTIGSIHAQHNPAPWTLTTKKVSACEYDLIFTVNIDKGWHIFSIVKSKSDGVPPTEIIFDASKEYTPEGNLTESKPVSEYDKTISTSVSVHYTKAVFTQRIKLNTTGKIKITGTHESQVCDNEKCLTPPIDKFSFDVQGSVCSIKK